MKLTILSAVTAALFAITASSASALPVAKPSQTGAQSSTLSEQVQYRKHRHRGHVGQHHRRHNNWRHSDRRYDKYRGWNRYSSRPHNYRSRGCAAVGPIWFCR